MIILQRIVDDGQYADQRTHFKRIQVASTVVDVHRQFRFTQHFAVIFVIPGVARQNDDIFIACAKAHLFFDDIDDMPDFRIAVNIVRLFQHVHFLTDVRCIKIVPLDELLCVSVIDFSDRFIHDPLKYMVRQIEHPAF